MFHCSRKRAWFVMIAATLTGASLPATAQETGEESAQADRTPARTDSAFSLGDITERQSIDSYTLLEDGQPGEPGHFELQFDLGWQTTSGERDPVLFVPEIKFTPDGGEFLRNMKLTLVVPMEFGLGRVEGNADAEFGWQQRWITEDGMMPTLATLAEIRIPSGYHSSGVDGTLTGIVAKELGPGTLYFNAFASTVNGHNEGDEDEPGLFTLLRPHEDDSGLRHFQWGLRAGYKWRISDELALTTAYEHRVSEEEGHGDLNLLEVSGQWRINEQITIGPGVFIGLDDNEETPNFGAGVRLTWSF